MKKLLNILLLLGIAFPVFGQEVGTFCKSASVKDGALDFTVTIPEGVINSDEILIVTPTLVTEQGIEAEQKPLLFIGKSQHPYYRRARALQDHEVYIEQTPYASAVVERRKATGLDYHIQVSDAPTLLKLRYEVRDCCDLRLLGTAEITPGTEKVEQKPFIFTLEDKMISPLLAVQKVSRKIQHENVEARFHYLFDKDQLLKDFRSNSTEIEKVQKAMGHLFTDKDMYTILEGEIVGYASPEGGTEYNLDLSRRRAASVKKYFTELYPEMANFSSTGRGDNWEGLKKALQNSSYSDKTGLLRLAENKDKEGLKKHPDYADLIQNIYPPLRLSTLTITYSPRNVTPEEAKKLLFTHPKDLSLYECYEAIEALVKEGRDRLELHKLVLKGHPEDPIARINYSSVALAKGKTDEAYNALKDLKNDARAANNLGLIYALRGDYESARRYFEKSSEPVARENLTRLQDR